MELLKKCNFVLLALFYMGFDSFIQRRNHKLFGESASFFFQSVLAWIYSAYIDTIIDYMHTDNNCDKVP